MPDTQTEAAALVAAIHTRRLIMCRVYGNHVEGGCQSCGTKDNKGDK